MLLCESALLDTVMQFIVSCVTTHLNIVNWDSEANIIQSVKKNGESFDGPLTSLFNVMCLYY